MVAPRLQRRGISRLMLAAMRGNARRLGFVDLYAPLRPTGKHLEPLTPFSDYVARRREDGLPYPTLKHTKTSNQCGTPHKAFLRCCRPSRPLR